MTMPGLAPTPAKVVTLEDVVIAAQQKSELVAFVLKEAAANSSNPERLKELLNSLEQAAPTQTTSSEQVGGAITNEPTAIKLTKEEFIAKYNVEVLGESQVRFTLPIGSSRIDLLDDAQAIRAELGQVAVYPSRLESWKNHTAFSASVSEATTFGVDGNVANSINLTRAKQKENGWNNVELCDLAAAHAANLIVTGKDLFAGNVVRACGRALGFYARGLDVDYYRDVLSYSYIAASALLPSLELKKS